MVGLTRGNTGVRKAGKVLSQPSQKKRAEATDPRESLKKQNGPRVSMEERTRIAPTFLAEPMTEMRTRMLVLDMVNLG